MDFGFRSSVAAVMVCLALPALAGTPDVTLLYDTEFGGYVPVVGGIERPDLAASLGEGRAPTAERVALRRARKGVRADAHPELPAALPPPGDKASARRPSRRWLRKSAITTEFLVLDGFGKPVSGARVYRYTDPSFYPVNQDESGARLFDTWRLLPVPFPAATAESLVRTYDAFWSAEGEAFVGVITPNIDMKHCPWTRGAITGMPPIELVGRTDENGMLRAVTGIFNLRDPRRFGRVIMPDALRVGFVVVADGFEPSVSERRYASGGLFENRTIQLLDGPLHPFFDSPDWRASQSVVDAWEVAARDASDFERNVSELLASLDVVLAHLAEADRAIARAEAEACIWERLAARVGQRVRFDMLRRAATATPAAPARVYRFAAALVEGEGLSAAPPRRAIAPSAPLIEAEERLAELIRVEPRFQPAYRLLDRLLQRRGAPVDERRGWANRLLREFPFDPWGRARLAALLLQAGRDAEAFDHLRYTYMAQPGMGGDRELALALSAHYWRIGLPEKAGAYAWLLTGRVPEDPTARPRFGR